MTENTDIAINRELAEEITRSIALMVVCAAHSAPVAMFHTALLQSQVCEAVEALAGGSVFRRTILIHQLRQAQERCEQG